MAKEFVARKVGQQKIQNMAPDVCLTQVGNALVPLPYNISETLDKAKKTASTVLFNTDEAFIKSSHSNTVIGDTQGNIKGGIVSGTKGKQSDPLTHSSTVKVEGKPLLRVGDTCHMNNKNTLGKIKGNENGSEASITDDGKIEGNTTSEEYKKFLEEQAQGAKEGFTEQAEELFPNVTEAIDDPKAFAEEVWQETQQSALDTYDATTDNWGEFADKFSEDPFGATKDQLAKTGKAIGDEVAQIGDDIDDWAEETGDVIGNTYDEAKELTKQQQYGQALGMGAATLLSVVVDVLNPGKKIQAAGKVLNPIATGGKKRGGGGDDGGGRNNNEEGAKSKGHPCKTVTIKMDCKGYPEDVPKFKMKKSPEIWEVEHPGTRGDSRKDLVDAFSEHLDKTKTKDNDVNRYFQKAYGVSQGELASLKKDDITSMLAQTVGSSKSGGPNSAVLPIHHLRPHWAGGNDGGSNLSPLDYEHHTAAGKPTIHDWWRNKLQGQQDELEKALKACDKKRAGQNNGKTKSRPKKLADMVPNKLSESNITTLAKKLKKEGSTLQVEMDCPGAAKQ